MKSGMAQAGVSNGETDDGSNSLNHRTIFKVGFFFFMVAASFLGSRTRGEESL